MARESDIEHKVVQWVQRQGGMTIKLTSPSARGIPDRMFVLPWGAIVFIEFKRPGGQLSQSQKYMIEKFKSFNLSVYVCDNYESAVKILATAPISN